MQLTKIATLQSPVVCIRGFVMGLPGRIRGTRGQAVEIAAHQLGDAALRHIAGKSHRARLTIDRQYGAHDAMWGCSRS